MISQDSITAQLSLACSFAWQIPPGHRNIEQLAYAHNLIPRP